MSIVLSQFLKLLLNIGDGKILEVKHKINIYKKIRTFVKYLKLLK